MPQTPTQLGSADGSVTALLPVVRDYTDDFIRRTEIGEADRVGGTPESAHRP